MTHQMNTASLREHMDMITALENERDRRTDVDPWDDMVELEGEFDAWMSSGDALASESRNHDAERWRAFKEDLGY